MLKIEDLTCSEFINSLSSKAAVPGGGGAAALAGSIGTALAGMVCRLTSGKKKFARFEEDLHRIVKKADEIQAELLKMVDEDAENFLPLSKAYGMPADTEQEKAEKEKVMQEALKKASQVPIKIVRICFEAIKLHQELIDKCSKLVISDVGVGVQCLRAAIIGGKLNVDININMITDGGYVDAVREEVERLVRDGVRIADDIYNKVEKALTGK